MVPKNGGTECSCGHLFAIVPPAILPHTQLSSSFSSEVLVAESQKTTRLGRWWDQFQAVVCIVLMLSVVVYAIASLVAFEERNPKMDAHQKYRYLGSAFTWKRIPEFQEDP